MHRITATDPDVMPLEGATEVYFNSEDDDCNVAAGDGDSMATDFGMLIMSL